MEYLNPKPVKIIGNKALADYLGYSVNAISKMKQEGILDGTFTQSIRKISYDWKKIDKFFKKVKKMSFRFKHAPLPFQGQKRNFTKAFSEEIKILPTDMVFIDLFGGSGLLSRTSKDIKPKSRVIYNDFDDYSMRLENILTTNEILKEIRTVVKKSRNKERIDDTKKELILRIIKEYEDSCMFVDYLTISSNVLFSSMLAKNYDELKKAKFYNRIIKGDYSSDGYLDGVEITKKDYKELYNEFKDVPNVFFILDPPYLSTDIKSYNKMSYWNLKDYLQIIPIIKNSSFAYFSSDKSMIIDLFEFLNDEYSIYSPFRASKKIAVNTSVSYNSLYKDTMYINTQKYNKQLQIFETT